jgi:endonuclease YncB( thermonuclease family)
MAKGLNMRLKSAVVGWMIALSCGIAVAGESEIVGYAFVQDTGMLRVNGYNIRLHGIYLPPTEHACHSFTRPAVCGTRAAAALEFHVGVEFLHCLPKTRHTDGTISAFCTAAGEDLAAWLLRQGWAVALPEAPFEYEALEKVARAQERGLWMRPVAARRWR